MTSFSRNSSESDDAKLCSVSCIEAVTRIVAVSSIPEHDLPFRTVHAWLQSRAASVEMLDELGRTLHDRVVFLVNLSDLVRKGSPTSIDDHLLRHWIESANRARSWLNDETGTAELVPLVSLVPIDEANPDAVLLSMVWETMVEWIAPQLVPRAVRDAVNFCAELARKWCRAIPVPPCHLRPWDLKRYIHKSQGLKNEVTPLLTELELWDDLTLEDYGDELIRHTPPVQNEFSAARFAVARDLLLEIFHEFESGWPIEADRLQISLREISTAISRVPLSIAFGPLNSKIVALDAALAARSNSMAPERPLLTGTEPEQGPCRMADDCPGALLRIYNWILSTGTEIDSTVSVDLAKIIERSCNCFSPQERTGVGRDLVSLLVDIDGQLATATGPTRGLSHLQGQLQIVLVEFFPYQLLDASTLVGCLHEEIRDRVRVRHMVHGTSIGRVVRVHRPGYLFLLADGRSSVIRPAEVDVAG